MDSTITNVENSDNNLTNLPPLPNLVNTTTTPLPPITNLLNLNSSLITELNEALGNQQLTPPPVRGSNSFSFTTSTNSPYIFRGTNENLTNTPSNSLSSNLTSQLDLPNPFQFNSLQINIPSNVFDSFSPEDAEQANDLEEGLLDNSIHEEEIVEEVLSDVDSTDSDDEIPRRRLLRVHELRLLPLNHFSFGIMWNFEKNYDYYKISSVKYFSKCKTSRYLNYKTQVAKLNQYTNMKLGKTWELKIPNPNINLKFIYFIIYFNNMKGHIDIEYYGLFPEEINEKKAIEQIIELELYGKTGRIHSRDMTCTDGNGFNLLKYEI